MVQMDKFIGYFRSGYSLQGISKLRKKDPILDCDCAEMDSFWPDCPQLIYKAIYFLNLPLTPCNTITDHKEPKDPQMINTARHLLQSSETSTAMIIYFPANLVLM